MKRRIVILLLLSVVVSFVAIPVFAQGNAGTHRETVIPPGTEIEIIIPPDISGTYDLDKGDTQQNVEEAKEYAYFDPDQFDSEMKEKIIDARTTIIFNSYFNCISNLNIIINIISLNLRIFSKRIYIWCLIWFE